MRTCNKCGGSYPDVFFGRDQFENYRSRKSERRAVCIGCQITSRTERKYENRPREKAIKAIGHHALKFGMKRSELVERYGWDAKQMAHDIEHAFKNGCPYCRIPFSQQPHGLADLSLDIINPNLPPYYRTNTKWVCKTCNAEKQHTPPDKWEEKLYGWELWRRNMEEHDDNPYRGLPLFEGLERDNDRQRQGK